MALQNHIHLSKTVSGSGEKAPNLKWVITDRLDMPQKFMGLKRTLTGKLKKHVLTDESGVVRLTNYKLTVKVQADYGYTLDQRIAQIKAMNGETVYFCDVFHAADNADHTSDNKTMVASIGDFSPVGPGLPFFLVDVELTDASR